MMISVECWLASNIILVILQLPMHPCALAAFPVITRMWSSMIDVHWSGSSNGPRIRSFSTPDNNHVRGHTLYTDSNTSARSRREHSCSASCTPCLKKVAHRTLRNIFAQGWPIAKISTATESEIRSQNKYVINALIFNLPKCCHLAN